jgi:hypothetical protein
MSIKTVEAYSRGELLAKHTILIGATDAPAQEADFIALAGESMLDDGISAKTVDNWIVRDPIAGE